MLRPLAAALAAGALLAMPASANPTCVGEQTLFYACVVTPTVGTGTHTLCVYAGGGSCKPVVVPVPTVTGQPGAYCGGSLCFSIDDAAICNAFSKIDPCP